MGSSFYHCLYVLWAVLRTVVPSVAIKATCTCRLPEPVSVVRQGKHPNHLVQKEYDAIMPYWDRQSKTLQLPKLLLVKEHFFFGLPLLLIVLIVPFSLVTFWKGCFSDNILKYIKTLMIFIYLKLIFSCFYTCLLITLNSSLQ